MKYKDFKEAIEDLPQQRQAFLTVLFFAGCRISEALALTSNDINCTADTVYIQFFRLKGSKQTDPTPLPRTASLHWLCVLEGPLFPWSRSTGYRIVKRVFPSLYPHYFRMNRITTIAEKFSLAEVTSYTGIHPLSVEHYLEKVKIKSVGQAMKEEIEK